MKPKPFPVQQSAAATKRPGAVVGAALIVLLAAGCAQLGDRPAAKPVPPTIIADCRARLAGVSARIPDITAAAEAVARRWVENRQVLLHYPFGGDTSNFSMEMCSRAGGLDNCQPNTTRLKLRSSNDAIVVAPRSWERGAEYLLRELPKAHTQGWMIVVFGSKNGMPAGLPADFLIDTGAADGGEEEAALNQVVNIVNGWMWCCELTAALTRLGWRPAILKGMPLPGAVAHNREYQRGDGLPQLYPCGDRIPPGALARSYLAAVETELHILESPATQKQIARAADMAARYLAAGKTVWAASFTHVLDGEVLVDNRSPIKAFRAISCGPKGETFTGNLKPGDLLFFFGEWTLNLPWLDYLALIRSTGADYVPSFRPSPEATEFYEGKEIFYDRRIGDARMVLEQRWPFENAAVAIPFPPGAMAPVSGVDVCLLYRMLDAAIAERLPGKE
jgi:hypothetical protein